MEVYLDHHNYAQPAAYAVEALDASYETLWGSMGTFYQKGAQIRASVPKYTEAIASLTRPSHNHTPYFFASYDECFVRLMRFMEESKVKKEGKNHFLVWPDISYHSEGCLIDSLPRTEGVIDLKAFKEALCPKTSFVYLPHADPVTGLIQPIEDIAQMCQEKEIHLHVDISHTLGKIPLLLEDFPEVTFSFSTQMLHTPQTSAVLFFTKDHDESFFQSELDIALLSATSAACRHAMLFMDQMALEKAHLKKQLEEGLASISTAPFKQAYTLPNHLVLLFPHIHGQMLSYRLSQKKIYISEHIKGVYLHQYAKEFHWQDEAHTGLIFTLSRFTTQEMISHTIAVIKEEVSQLQKKTEGLIDVGTV
jgi:cysteine desulfurase